MASLVSSSFSLTALRPHALESAGIELDAESSNGECRRCRVGVEHGQTRALLPSALLLPAEQVLACTAAASDLVLHPVAFPEA